MFKYHSTSDCKQKMKTKLSRAEASRAEETQAGTTGVGAIKEPATRIFFLHHLRKIPRDITA